MIKNEVEVLYYKQFSLDNLEGREENMAKLIRAKILELPKTEMLTQELHLINAMFKNTESQASNEAQTSESSRTPQSAKKNETFSECIAKLQGKITIFNEQFGKAISEANIGSLTYKSSNHCHAGNVDGSIFDIDVFSVKVKVYLNLRICFQELILGFKILSPSSKPILASPTVKAE